ncbi:uncharacterized protein LOC131244271 [Magnolia sinica]|uniref:uncharacterized protein LOC131244271 n=1 Tax=Magnolia sinica TaxID=86752 RepID=UPI0026589D06|nr:uncharacterized protein LOC131244271 [Magnolia sinica]
MRERYCDGFDYHRTKCGRDLHPYCASLPRVIGDNEVKLNLHHKVRSNCHKCGWMERRKWATSWSYVSTCEGYCFHVSCVKDMLVERWEKGYFGPYGEVGENGLALETSVQSLQLTLPNNNCASGKFNKYWRILNIGALKFIISVLIGDPTAVVAGLIASVISS